MREIKNQVEHDCTYGKEYWTVEIIPNGNIWEMKIIDVDTEAEAQAIKAQYETPDTTAEVSRTFISAASMQWAYNYTDSDTCICPNN